MKILAKASTILDKMVDWMAYLSGVGIILLMLMISADVISRFLWDNPINGVTETSEHAMLVVTFFGTTWVLKRHKHVQMEFLLNKLTAESNALLNAIFFVVGALVCLILAWYSGVATLDAYNLKTIRGTLLQTPMAPLLSIIVIGFFLLFLQCLKEVHLCLEKRRKSASS